MHAKVEKSFEKTKTNNKKLRNINKCLLFEMLIVFGGAPSSSPTETMLYE